MTGPTLTGKRRTASDAEARALASAVRLRILRACFDEALTNKQIADRLGRNPATVLHHVRTLVETGFLVAAEPRRGARGAREVPYRATGKSWLTQIEQPQGRNAMLAAFLEDVAVVGEQRLDSSRVALRVDAEGLEEFRTRLLDLLDDFAGRPPPPAAQRWSLFVGIHPEDPV